MTLFSHQPADYVCPFCELLSDNFDKKNRPEDIVYQNDLVTATVAPYWWVNNPGSLLVFPNQHYENIYDIPDDVLAEVYKTVKRMAIAVRSAYDNCTGISTRQHNEPDADQTIWHLHVHLFARFKDDDLYVNYRNHHYVEPEKRLPYGEQLRTFLQLQTD